ncbi:MAG: hypothetical protein VB957_08620 [Pseudomonadales bacterium]|jgi:hypothetical protein
MPVRLNKPWLPLNPESLHLVKGQLGVFELGSDDDGVTFIGCADARSLFGLKGELQNHLDQIHLDKKNATHFRIEITSAYQTRYRELLMVHYADHGSYPRDNDESELPRLGRLSPL